MTNGENPQARRMLEQHWEIWRTALRTARLLMKSEEPVQWESSENSERYYSLLPMLAMRVADGLLSMTQFFENAPEKDQESHMATMATLLREAKAFNDKREAEQA